MGWYLYVYHADEEGNQIGDRQDYIERTNDPLLIRDNDYLETGHFSPQDLQDMIENLEDKYYSHDTFDQDSDSDPDNPDRDSDNDSEYSSENVAQLKETIDFYKSLDQFYYGHLLIEMN